MRSTGAYPTSPSGCSILLWRIPSTVSIFLLAPPTLAVGVRARPASSNATFTDALRRLPAEDDHDMPFKSGIAGILRSVWGASFQAHIVNHPFAPSALTWAALPTDRTRVAPRKAGPFERVPPADLALLTSDEKINYGLRRTPAVCLGLSIVFFSRAYSDHKERAVRPTGGRGSQARRPKEGLLVHPEILAEYAEAEI